MPLDFARDANRIRCGTIGAADEENRMLLWHAPIRYLESIGKA
jgi:hypothetical protein